MNKRNMKQIEMTDLNDSGALPNIQNSSMLKNTMPSPQESRLNLDASGGQETFSPYQMNRLIHHEDNMMLKSLDDVTHP